MNTEQVPSVVFPRDLAERIHQHLSNCQDEGPSGESWKSLQLLADIKAVAELLRARSSQNNR